MEKIKNPEDIVGQTFNELTVLEYVGMKNTNNKHPHYRPTYRCLCSCGKECFMERYKLLTGRTKSCGHLIHYRRKDLVGKTFGKLTVLSYDHSTKSGGVYYLCQCECGNKKAILARALVTGATISCGCHWKNDRKFHTTHGMSNTRLYTIWAGMKDRCNNPNNPHFDRYGGRGIFVCEEWDTSFENFYNDMHLLYENAISTVEDEHEITLDRINNDDGYYKENCRWATKDIQNYNKRSTRYMEYNGEVLPMTKLWEKYGEVSLETFKTRIRKGCDLEFALKYQDNSIRDSLFNKNREYWSSQHLGGWCPIEFLDDKKGV